MKKFIKNIVVIFLILIIIYGLFFANIWLKGNFHTITQNQAYRSRQLDKKLLAFYITKYNIKSIINLRGKEKGVKWYDDELKVCSIYNIVHYDLDLAIDRKPRNEDIQYLLKIFKTTPRPVLIHCLGGADRTGLVATLWKLCIDKEDKKSALNQMSFFYGHMPFGKATILDRWLLDNISSDNVLKIENMIVKK